jgi:glycosyltransferase involved in cell wall biosynthesis
VIDGKTGYLAESDEELSGKLDVLIRDHELRIAMGKAAAIHSQNFDWDRITLQWQDAFEEAVALRRKP